jgi:hypothetical protein
VCILEEMGLHAAKNALAAALERRVAFPPHIFGENPNGVDPGVSGEISERRQPPDTMPAEQLPAGSLNLSAPNDGS